MGGRGSSTGVSANGKKYGAEYKSILTSGNIKFVVRLDNSAAAPMETMTNNRVYVTLSPQGELNVFHTTIKITSEENKLIWIGHIEV